MRQTQALLISNNVVSFRVVEFACRLCVIKFEASYVGGFNFWKDLKEGELVAPIALIHLQQESYHQIKPPEMKEAIVQMNNILQCLPERTRRVLISNAFTVSEAMRDTAIMLEGDLAVALQALKFKPEKTMEIVKGIIGKGWVSEKEISERGVTIELSSGSREGVSAASERIAKTEHDYGDDYYRRKK